MSTHSVRPAAHAGRFYPFGAQELRHEIERYIEAASPQTGEAPAIGFVSPHAGYTFSGPCAGHVYRQIQALRPEIVFVLAPSHHGSFSEPSIWDGKAYATPLGEYPIDRETVEKIKQHRPGIGCHRWEEEQEHSLEVQIPFLQVACPDSRLVPILIGQQMKQNICTVADTIEAAVQGRARGTYAFVASSDAYHGYSLDECHASDARLATDVQAMDIEALFEDSMSRRTMACGLGPIAAVIDASKRLGAKRATILNQATSADAMPRGPQDYVVGYLAAMFD